MSQETRIVAIECAAKLMASAGHAVAITKSPELLVNIAKSIDSYIVGPPESGEPASRRKATRAKK